MEHNAIYLLKHPESWMALYAGPHQAIVIAEFGTHLLPTAYTSELPEERVLALIRCCNRGVHVAPFFPPL